MRNAPYAPFRRHFFHSLAAALVVACQAQAAHVSSAGSGPGLPSPCLVLTRQIVRDSAIEATFHPLRTGRELAAESARDLCAACRGLFGKRLRMRLLGPPAPLPLCRGTLDPAALEADLRARLGTPLQPAHIQLYPEGAEALAALKGLIDQATCQIDIFMFQWEDDAVGNAVAAWLAAKAGPQVRVRILIDGGGNLMFGGDDNPRPGDVNRVVCALARQPCVEVLRTRNPFGWFDHRKLVVVDGRWAWSGGRNFTHECFFDQRDLSFTLTGPLVGDLQQNFELFWREQGGKPGTSVPFDPCPVENAYARLASTGPGKHHLGPALYRAVDRACDHIYLENFCVCDSHLVYKLAKARRRGVDVRVVLTVSSSTESANHTNRVTANRLLKAGVRVYAYPGMTHTKAATVDGCWAYVGTGNFDPLSLRRNRELGLSISGGPLIAEVEEQVFLPDFRPEWELTSLLPLSGSDYAWELFGSLFL